MNIEKIRAIGTNIENHINYFYRLNTEYIKYDESISETKFKDMIEILLSLGIVEPMVGSYFEKKSQFLSETFIATGVDMCNLDSSFLKMLNGPLMYKGQEQLFENICLVNQAYNFDTKGFDELDIVTVEVVLRGEMDLRNAKFWVLESLNSPSLIIEMKKYVGILDKFNTAKMDKKYLEFHDENAIRKYALQEEVRGEIYASPYNINTFINEFAKNKYHIPIYQRNYVWTEDSIDRLIDDIMENEYINLNNITLHTPKSAKPEKEYNIIDGQQRITTLFLTLIALQRYLNNYFSIFDREKVEDSTDLLNVCQYINKHLFEYDKIVTNFIRIEGNDDYEAFYTLLNNIEADAKIRNTTVYRNYSRIFERIDGMTNDEIFIFATRFLNNVIFVLTVDAESDEFTLFENLNTTSIPLSTIDLIKSYLLSLLDDNIGEKEIIFQKEFNDKVTKILDEGEKNTSIDNFMRVYIRTHLFKLDNKYSLLEQYKRIHPLGKKSLNFTNVSNILEEFSNQLKIYQYITRKRYNKPQISIDKLEIEDFIDILGDRDIYAPIMIYLINKFRADELTSNEVRLILFELERFEVIFKICSYRGQSLTSVMDNVLNKMSKLDDLNVDEFRIILNEEKIINRTLSIDKKAFKSTFDEFNFSEQLSRIVLTRITNYLKNNSRIELKAHDNIRRMESPSVEHMMPVTATKWLEAKVVTEEEHQSLLNKIGNHFLLESKLNSNVKNNLFSEKIKVISEYTHMDDDLTYKKNSNNVGFEVKGLSKFNAKTIRDRQKYITKIAVEIWKG